MKFIISNEVVPFPVRLEMHGDTVWVVVNDLWMIQFSSGDKNIVVVQKHLDSLGLGLVVMNENGAVKLVN